MEEDIIGIVCSNKPIDGKSHFIGEESGTEVPEISTWN